MTPGGARPGPDRLRRGVATAAGRLGRGYAGPGHRAFSLAARAVHRFPPAGEIAYRDADGYDRSADLADHMEALVFVGRHRLPKAAVEVVRPGDWAVDVGANVGSVSGQLCRAVGPSGLVWAFEPVPRNVRRLRDFASRNRLDHLEVFDCALSSQRGRAPIRLGESSGHASFTASWISSGAVEVATERLDDVVDRMAPTKPLRLLKLDVEGFERQVLEGARATVLTHRPVVHCEFNDIILRDAGSSSAELLGDFRELGYRVAPGWRRRSRRLEGRNVDLLLVP